MSDKTEYFNAKVAGDYLGEQWVVRGSDFDAVERQKLELIEALDKLHRDSLSSFDYRASPRCAEIDALLANLEAEGRK